MERLQPRDGYSGIDLSVFNEIYSYLCDALEAYMADEMVE
jgi:hypothetical protein